MCNNNQLKAVGVMVFVLLLAACSGPALMQKKPDTSKIPANYSGLNDSNNSAQVKWKSFFTDPYLQALIDTALNNNQELNVMMQEINIARNEVKARKGEYLPFVGLNAAAGAERSARYTRNGAVDANTNIADGKAIPDPLGDLMLGPKASWEIDVWKKLRNARKAAVSRYLASVEGKNFMVTHLISEIAQAYYELMALDNQLSILQQNITIQQNALEVVKLQKSAARVTELAVRKFEAEVLKNQSRQYAIIQQITETENHLNFLVGRFPQHIDRNSGNFIDLVPVQVMAGIPAQLLSNRPDVRQAEQELQAANLDVRVAKAAFYPSLTISAGLGYQAFNTNYLLRTPESLMYNVGGDLIAPLINRNAIKANYASAGAKAVQAVYHYERAILNAHIEVVNQLAMINNLEQSYQLKNKQVQALTASIDISTVLFKSARADYMEVLMTQRDALESRFELIETKKQQLSAAVHVYQALGGGWR